MRAKDRDVVIVGAVRTPIGRGRAEGIFAGVHANELLGAVYAAVIERSDIDAAQVEAVVAGCGRSPSATRSGPAARG